MSDPAVPYPAGLLLRGRRVVVVGGGQVAARRVPGLLAAGADVVLVSPRVGVALSGLSESGRLVWRRRAFTDADLDDAWYVIAATDDPQVNESVAKEADRRRIFCVRSDDADGGSAWTPAVGQHAGVSVAVLGQKDPRRSATVRDQILERLRTGDIADRHHRRRQPGVVLVGGGPGDPDLITVAGRRALAEADVVVADRLAPLALLDELSADVEVVDAAKLPRGRSTPQQQINRLLVDRARSGRQVVRLKGGDAFVFGRGYEEVQACMAAGVACRVVPGVSSATAVPMLAGIPLTHRGVAQEFSVVSGHLPPGHPDSSVDWDALARLRGTLVLLMAVENLAAIAAALVRSGKDPHTPVSMVSEGSSPAQHRVDAVLADCAERAAEAGVRAPAVVVVGEVTRLAS